MKIRRLFVNEFALMAALGSMVGLCEVHDREAWYLVIAFITFFVRIPVMMSIRDKRFCHGLEVAPDEPADYKAVIDGEERWTKFMFRRAILLPLLFAGGEFISISLRHSPPTLLHFSFLSAGWFLLYITQIGILSYQAAWTRETARQIKAFLKEENH